jgi:integrase
MAKGRLTQDRVDKLTTPGVHPDGSGLCLQVRGPEARSWIFRYTLHGQARWLGLGSASRESNKYLTLAQARTARDDARAEIRKGNDPVKTRRDERQQHRQENRKAITFRERANQYLRAHEDGWKNAKHREQWHSTLERYVFPIIGDLPAEAITASHVVDILRPIWTEIPETARRTRGRIESVLDYAADPDDVTYRNPAAMNDRLFKKLPKAARTKQVINHPALPYSEIAAFMADLRTRDGVAPRALEFTILTACRTNEVLSARWDEIDLGTALWVIPAERMKSNREHRVPLPRAAVAVLERMQALRLGDVVFPSAGDRPLSNMAMLTVLRRMGHADITTHGFRSTFRDWAAELTSFPREIAEKALAHAVGDDTERAYQRGDLLDKRRRLMDQWAVFCNMPAPAGEVVPLRSSL